MVRVMLAMVSRWALLSLWGIYLVGRWCRGGRPRLTVDWWNAGDIYKVLLCPHW